MTSDYSSENVNIDEEECEASQPDENESVVSLELQVVCRQQPQPLQKFTE